MWVYCKLICQQIWVILVRKRPSAGQIKFWLFKEKNGTCDGGSCRWLSRSGCDSDCCCKGENSDCCRIALLKFIPGGCCGGASGGGDVVVDVVVVAEGFWWWWWWW